MSDYASILGADQSPSELVGQGYDIDRVEADWAAAYFLNTPGYFLDRFDTSGDSRVDATGAPGGVMLGLGSGTDTVNAGAGDDSIWAGGEADIVDAGGGDNTVSGADGADFIVSYGGDDSLMGGSDDDWLDAGAGNDHVAGGNGRDTLLGRDGADSLYGQSGDDMLQGGSGNDHLMGGSGADSLVGGSGNDTMFGGSGGDVFAFDDGFGQDVISDFGPGDTIHLAADLNGSNIRTPADVARFVGGGVTEAGTAYTTISIGGDTIRLERVDSADFLANIADWVQITR